MSSEATDPTVEELVERIEQLEETQQELKQGAVDNQGRTWTLSDLLNFGLTRRQALAALGAIAGGAALPVAFTQAVKAAPGDDGDTVWGSASNRDDYYADEIDANSVNAGRLATSSRAAQYVVWDDGSGTVYADGPDDFITQDTDFSSVLNAVIADLPTNPNGWSKIYVQVDNEVSSTVTIDKNFVDIDINGHIKLADGANTDIFHIDAASGANYVKLRGSAVIDGNTANNSSGSLITKTGDGKTFWIGGFRLVGPADNWLNLSGGGVAFVEGNRANGTGGQSDGFVINSPDSIIRFNDLGQAGGTAIDAVNSTNSRIIANQVYNSQRGIRVGAKATVMMNRAADIEGAGIVAWFNKRQTILCNVCKNTGMDTSLTGAERAGIRLNQTSSQTQVAYNMLWDTQPTPTMTYGIIANATTDAIIGPQTFDGNQTERAVGDFGTRTRRNGAVFLSAAPTASNYDRGDSGMSILDTSTAPPTEYKVLDDGSVTTVQ